MRTIVCVCLLFTLTLAVFGEETVLLEDSFSSYPAGPLLGVVGAHAEYHYLPETTPRGPWAVSTFRSDSESQLAWRAIRVDGKPALAMMTPNKMKHTHPMVVAGDEAWRHYTFAASVVPMEGEGRCGVAVRYQNDRCYYFAGVENGNAFISRLRHEKAFREPDEAILAQAAFVMESGKTLSMRVTVSGSKLSAALNDSLRLEADDTTYTEGRVALLSDIPAKFLSARVVMASEEKARVDAENAQRATEENTLQESNPTPVLWKKVQLKDTGVGRNLRFGDLNGDGQIDFAVGQVVHHGPKDSNSEISCITAYTFDGTKLWQVGKPDTWRNHLTNDVAFQIHDWDGDGKNEVIYCASFEILILDGATGEVKKRVPTSATPPNAKPPHNKFNQILGDSIFFCDLRGTGRDADMILKDRYMNYWAYDNDLNIMWRGQCMTGHYPYAADIDNDGKDEVMIGYTLVDSDGTKLWSIEGGLKDHADGIAMAQFTEGGPWRALWVGSDEGTIIADIQGNVLKHHRLGHVQNPAIADFRPDLPGLEAVSINYWSNQGIVHFYNADGDPYLEFEPFQHGSLCMPINWTGAQPEFVVLSVNADEGGMVDGWGRRAVRFPADGHPDLAYNIIDVTGDCRDEVIVWDPTELWVYTQSDSPKAGKLYKPLRNPNSNDSNYRCVVSLPAWSE
ncbi:MAG: hypothetical protein IT366_12990 [Candidatus Hydrogenedentes bacterium]|nr:hypothetical protein [Candidatus Hydrogenedentota bacterium]